jgi:hypothetical protein
VQMSTKRITPCVNVFRSNYVLLEIESGCTACAIEALRTNLHHSILIQSLDNNIELISTEVIRDRNEVSMSKQRINQILLDYLTHLSCFHTLD